MKRIGPLLAGCWLLFLSFIVSPTLAASRTSKLKVALITPGKINDHGWNQMANEALQAIKTQTEAQVIQITAQSDDQQRQALRSCAEKHYDIIFCHGYEFGDRAKSLAPKFPNTKFVIVAGNVMQSPNVMSLRPELEEATYLLGMVAGGMAGHNKIGAIGGMELPVIKSTFDSFARGAKSTNPRVRVISNYVGDFEDKDRARHEASEMIDDGVNFIFHNADQAGRGVYRAAANSHRVYVFGSNRDENDLAPNVGMASAVIDFPKVFVKLTNDIAAHRFIPGIMPLNMHDGFVYIAWNSKLKQKIPTRLMRRVERSEVEIKSGRLKIKSSAW